MQISLYPSSWLPRDELRDELLELLKQFSHVNLHGAAGMGKTVAIKQLLFTDFVQSFADGAVYFPAVQVQ